MALFEARTASTISELVDVLHEILTPGATRWFRGQANNTWRLIPGLGRPPNRAEAELALVKRFRQNAYAAQERLDHVPKDDWYWLFLMQHYGAPTRLLDWTENPLVALYFAVADEKEKESDGAFWCLDPMGLNAAAFVQPTFASELPFFGIDEDLDVYKSDEVDRSSRPSKPPVAALAPRYFRRLAAQAGVFTITHREQSALEDSHDGKFIGRITIPRDSKPLLQQDLAVLGITRLSLFPELDSVATFAKEAVK